MCVIICFNRKILKEQRYIFLDICIEFQLFYFEYVFSF